LVTPDNTSNGNAYGRMYLQTRIIKNSQWYWQNNLVLRSSGNVGIGTDTPGTLLELKAQNKPTRLKLQADTDQNTFITFTPNTGAEYQYNVGYDNTNDIFSITGNCFPSTSGLHITHSGNVLIGKTSQANSDYKLDVNGKIRANEIKINTTGADFVFESTYNLKSLAEVEKFISDNKHLPEISSASEMNKNGVDLGDLNMKLLQKVEELTLYTIEQQKRIEKLEKQVQQLANQNNSND